jgi:hypothetical protein
MCNMESASATSPRKVTDSLSHWQNSCEPLIAALKDEDQLLRNHLKGCPRLLRETRGPDGALSAKETLGHIAFWDNFTVDFFSRKLDVGSCDPAPPINFEERSREALKEVQELPFGEVLARYLEATGALVEFVQASWERLTPRERADFRVPLKHRRHHRIALERAIRENGVGPEEMAAGA